MSAAILPFLSAGNGIGLLEGRFRSSCDEDEAMRERGGEGGGEGGRTLVSERSLPRPIRIFLWGVVGCRKVEVRQGDRCRQGVRHGGRRQVGGGRRAGEQESGRKEIRGGAGGTA